jgi:hypothetical protein
MIEKRTRYGVSEIIGTLTLLIIAVSVFSLVYVSVLTNLNPSSEKIVNISGTMENGNIILEHKGGESLPLETKFKIRIGNYDIFSFELNDENVTLLTSEGANGKINNFWDISEQLFYYDENFTAIDEDGPKIEVFIIDVDTNSLKLVGTLQDGFTIEGNKGGIWLFEEEETSLTAIDSSRNNNNGTLGLRIRSIFIPTLNGPQRINNSNGGIVNNSLLFDGIYDVVNVPDCWGLDISDNLTIEAWLNPNDVRTVDTIDFSEDFGYNPFIINISNNIKAIAFIEQGKGGSLKTVNITSKGDISNVNFNNYYNFEPTNNSADPNIIHISGNNYVIAYTSSNHKKGYVISVEIKNNGSITQPFNDSIEFDPNACYNPFLVKISDNMFAVTYQGSGSDGYIKTYSITNDGDIGNTETDVEIFDTDNCNQPKIINLEGENYSIVYSGKNYDGYIKTYEIKNDGMISDTEIDVFEFDTVDCYWPNIINLAQETYAIVYNDNSPTTGGQGIIKTLQINTDGVIVKAVNDSYIFETDRCLKPNISHILDDNYLISYEGSSQDGYIITLEMTLDGTINSTITNPVIFNPSKEEIGRVTQGNEPKIIRISDYVFAVSYRDQSPHPGTVLTIRVIDGIIPVHTRGIYKAGSYGLFANHTHVLAIINDEIVTESISGWGHIALTYDGINMRLYFNGSLIKTHPYSSSITLSSSNLLLGTFYKGIMDEVAIYDIALTEEQINDHMNNSPSPIT